MISTTARSTALHGRRNEHSLCNDPCDSSCVHNGRHRLSSLVHAQVHRSRHHDRGSSSHALFANTPAGSRVRRPMSWKSFLGWKQVCRHLSTLKTNLGQNVLTSRPRFRGSAPQPARLPPPSPLVQACPCPLRDAPHLSRPDTSATAEGRCEHASKTGIYKPFVIRELKPPSPAQQLDGFARGNSPQEQLRPEGLRTTASSST